MSLGTGALKVSGEGPEVIQALQGGLHGNPVRQRICARGALSWGRGESGVRDMARPLLGNLGAKSSEMSFPYFKTYFMQISRCYL